MKPNAGSTLGPAEPLPHWESRNINWEICTSWVFSTVATAVDRDQRDGGSFRTRPPRPLDGLPRRLARPDETTPPAVPSIQQRQRGQPVDDGFRCEQPVTSNVAQTGRFLPRGIERGALESQAVTWGRGRPSGPPTTAYGVLPASPGASSQYVLATGRACPFLPLFSVGVWFAFAGSLPDARLGAPVVQQVKARICPCGLPSAMILEERPCAGANATADAPSGR